LAHAGGYLVGHGAVYFLTATDGIGQAFIGFITQEFAGCFEGENVLAENGGDFGGTGSFYFIPGVVEIVKGFESE
jgi:hypothetical protein